MLFYVYYKQKPVGVSVWFLVSVDTEKPVRAVTSRRDPHRSWTHPSRTELLSRVQEIHDRTSSPVGPACPVAVPPSTHFCRLLFYRWAAIDGDNRWAARRQVPPSKWSEGHGFEDLTSVYDSWYRYRRRVGVGAGLNEGNTGGTRPELGSGVPATHLQTRTRKQATQAEAETVDERRLVARSRLTPEPAATHHSLRDWNHRSWARFYFRLTKRNRNGTKLFYKYAFWRIKCFKVKWSCTVNFSKEFKSNVFKF